MPPSASMRRAYVLLALALSACHSWPSRPAGYLGVGGRTIRVVTNGGLRRIVLEDAALVGDSLIGRHTETDTLRVAGWERVRVGSGDRSAIASAAVTRVEVRELNKQRTFAPLALLGIAAAVTVSAIALRAIVSLYTY